MHPVAALALSLIALAVGWLIARHQPGSARRAEVRRLRAEHGLYVRALLDVEAAADLYRDIDSPLATEIRTIVRTLNTNRLENK